MFENIQQRKGILGMDTAKAFLLAIFVIVILGFAIVIALSQIGDSGAATSSGSLTVTNETGGFINSTGYTLDEASRPDANSFSISEARNASDGTVIGAGNYTVDSNGVVTNATATTFSDVNFDYDLKYNKFSPIEGNVSDGVVDFFGNAGTWFSLLAVVIIILVIALVIIAVQRFNRREPNVGL